MDVDRDLILKVARNARLSLSEGEMGEFVPQFREILESFSRLREVDTSGVVPSTQPVPVRNVLREDVPGACVSQEDILSNTRHRRDGYFVGPKAI